MRQTPDAQPRPKLRAVVLGEELRGSSLLAMWARSRGVELTPAATLGQARDLLSQQRTHLLLIESDFADQDAAHLVQEIRDRSPVTQVVAVTHEPTVQAALTAMRLGVCEYLSMPLDPSRIGAGLSRALHRCREARRRQVREQRLRRLCRKLQDARRSVVDQVNTLCNDLVVAYQDLATQMNDVARSSAFAAVMAGDLDLDTVIRKTLQYLLDQAGPTNVAILLPCSDEDYGVGGYANYDMSKGSPEILLSHLATVVAPRVAAHGAMVHLRSDEDLRLWLGDDWNYLAQSHVLAMPCLHDGETLAVLMLFRDSTEAYSDSFLQTLEKLGPDIAAHLARVVRIHHRMKKN